MELLKEYFRLQKEIYQYFGYVEDWVVIPLEDATKYNWYFDGRLVHFSEKPFTVELVSEGKEMYQNELYTQRFLPKWVYEGPEYTMICVDTHTDGNKFLQVFDNSKKLINPSPELIAAFHEWDPEVLMEKYYQEHPHMRAIHQQN
jgi:hypothetical protein